MTDGRFVIYIILTTSRTERAIGFRKTCRRWVRILHAIFIIPEVPITPSRTTTRTTRRVFELGTHMAAAEEKHIYFGYPHQLRHPRRLVGSVPPLSLRFSAFLFVPQYVSHPEPLTTRQQVGWSARRLRGLRSPEDLWYARIFKNLELFSVV